MAASKKVFTTVNVRSTRIVEAGPRGWRFGKTWNQLVKKQQGIAVHPAFINKLKAHAKVVGVSAAGKDPRVIAERIAAVL
jgi:hypothetical protein